MRLGQDEVISYSSLKHPSPSQVAEELQDQQSKSVGYDAALHAMIAGLLGEPMTYLLRVVDSYLCYQSEGSPTASTTF